MASKVLALSLLGNSQLGEILCIPLEYKTGSISFQELQGFLYGENQSIQQEEALRNGPCTELRSPCKYRVGGKGIPTKPPSSGLFRKQEFFYKVYKEEEKKSSL